MTKVQVRFRLSHPEDPALLPRLADAHSIYGVFRITLSPDRGAITVEYDATRLRPAEVEAAILGAGIALEPALA